MTKLLFMIWYVYALQCRGKRKRHRRDFNACCVASKCIFDQFERALLPIYCLSSSFITVILCIYGHFIEQTQIGALFDGVVKKFPIIEFYQFQSIFAELHPCLFTSKSDEKNWWDVPKILKCLMVVNGEISFWELWGQFWFD